MADIPSYLLRQDGTPPPQSILDMYAKPHVLRACAQVRLDAAKDHESYGDTLAAHRCRVIAQRMLMDAERMGCK